MQVAEMKVIANVLHSNKPDLISEPKTYANWEFTVEDMTLQMEVMHNDFNPTWFRNLCYYNK